MSNELQQKIQAITDRYMPLIKDLEARGQKMAADFSQPDAIEAVIDVDFTVEWKDIDLIFDLPSVTMHTQEVALDVPEVTLVQNDIIFHTPSIRMVDKKVGQYPEFHGPFTIVWKDIIISVPEPFMQEQRIVLGLPSVTMKRQEWTFDLPEFHMEQQHWKIGLPQITVKKISAETQRLAEQGKQLQTEAEQLTERMKQEINAVMGFGKVAAEQGRSEVSREVLQSFDSAIGQLQQSVAELEAKGIDPIKVPSDQGDINLRKSLADLIGRRAEAASATAQPAQEDVQEPDQSEAA